MNKKTKKDLIRAGEEIAREESYFICSVIGKDWQNTAEAKMFNPNTIVWWGKVTTGQYALSDDCRNARLLGIAFMITMPKELLGGGEK